MRERQEVVEDYRSTGLSLRRRPVAFLRATLRNRGMVACANLLHGRDGRRAKGVTVEDETGVAKLVLWPGRFAARRALVLSASTIACHGRVQREGEVVQVVADWLEDLSDLLRGVGGLDGTDAPDRPPGSAIRVPTCDFR